jgi:pimeloyl-ACP methyl ester carboxylesterase
VVLLHAFPTDSRMWDGLRPALGARLVTPDLPGFGSAPPAAASDLDLAAETVLATLDRLGAERAIVGGCSMGGYVAMALLRRAPSRVSGLILVNTKASADTEPARANRFAMADRASAEGIGWLADEMRTTLLGATTLAERPEVEARLRVLIADQSPAAVAWAQRAMAARPDSFDVLRVAGLPALVVRGVEDTLIPGEEAAALVSALPESTFVELPEAGHLAPLEAPEEVAAALRDWLP